MVASKRPWFPKMDRCCTEKITGNFAQKGAGHTIVQLRQIRRFPDNYAIVYLARIRESNFCSWPSADTIIVSA